jgi:hypothetical protein
MSVTVNTSVSGRVPGRQTVSDSWKTKSFIFLFKRLMYVTHQRGGAHEHITGGNLFSKRVSFVIAEFL